MKEFLALDKISPVVNDVLGNSYKLVKESSNPVGIMLRSFSMHEYDLPKSILCIGRAGAGTNNIPSPKYGEQGVVVFNTPGANANAVKELVILAMLLSGRKVTKALEWTQNLVDGEKTVVDQVEKGKGNFVGNEIFGKTLAVYGLGAIGMMVANAAAELGMKVKGFDPFLSEENAKKLHKNVKRVASIDELIDTCNFLTLHVPFTPETKEFVNAKTLAKMADGVNIINCARGELVCDNDIIEAVNSGKVNRYVTDFPNSKLLHNDNIVCIPHLGASSPEAEDNCAVMAGNQMIDFIENGNIVNSVNYPAVKLEKGGKQRLVVLMKAQPDCACGKDCCGINDKIKAALGNAKILAHACGKNKAFAACLFNLDAALNEGAIKQLESLEGVTKIRVI